MFFKNLFRRNEGSVIVIVALLMTVFCGFIALVTDIGIAYAEKAQLQNAIDAAALAAVQELPNTTNATNVANQYIQLNGFNPSDVTITFSDSNTTINITGTKNVNYTFAKIIGLDSTTVNTKSAAKTGIAASVPWIVPFVIPKPPQFNYDQIYVMRMYGAGDFLDYPSTGYPNGYQYPTDWKTDSVYGQYTLSNRYPYQFDYMNVYIKQNTNFNDYIYWLENGYHDTFTVNQKMYYYAPSSGGQASVDAFARRVQRDSNTDYKKAKVGDGRVILIPIVESMLKRNTSQSGNVPIKIIGFTGFFIQNVHKNSYGTSFWFEGRFLKDLDVGTGEVTFDTTADFGLRAVKLTE